MNHSTTIMLADDTVRAISCVFENIDRDWTFGDSKEYTYKTYDKSIKEGDIVVVECQGPSKEFGMAFVKVVAVDVDVDYSDSIKYKWVIQKVNTKALEETLRLEKELVARVRSMEKSHKKNQLKAALAESGILFDRLSIGSSSGGRGGSGGCSGATPTGSCADVPDFEIKDSEAKDSDGFPSWNLNRK